MPVTVKGDESITLQSGKYGIRLEADRNITLIAKDDNIINVTTKEGSSDDVGDGINVTENAGSTITLQGANNTITVIGEHSDGIYTAEGSRTSIDLIANANNGVNKITATNNGIDHRGNGDVILKAEKGQNIITADGGDGVRVDGIGNVTLTAKENTINAGDNGIQVAGGGTVNVTAKNGNNIITANTNGIYANIAYGGKVDEYDGGINKINLSGKQGLIKVENKDSDVTGIYLNNWAQVDLNTNTPDSDKLEINAISEKGDSTGINVTALNNWYAGGSIINTNSIKDFSILAQTDNYSTIKYC